MRLLVTVIVATILAIAVVAWRFATVDVTPDSVRPAPTRSVRPPTPATAVVSEAAVVAKPEHAATPEGVSAAAVPPPELPPVTVEQPVVQWASEQGPRGARERLAAAREFLAREPDHPAALRDELRALRELGDWSAVADTLARMVALEPDNDVLRFEYAEALVRDKRWASAIDPLRECVVRQPNDVQAWLYLAAAQQTLGHLHDAEHSWSRVLELRPDDDEALAHRGEVRLSLHDWAGAAGDLERACSREPEAVDHALSLARALSQLGREPEARRCAEGVLARHPQNVRAMNALAELTWRAYRTDPATAAADLEATIEWCRRSLEIDPAQPAVRALLDAALREQ